MSGAAYAAMMRNRRILRNRSEEGKERAEKGEKHEDFQ